MDNDEDQFLANLDRIGSSSMPVQHNLNLLNDYEEEESKN